ncbi:hypothetical protein D3C73_1540920 [compost metagenome]
MYVKQKANGGSAPSSKRSDRNAVLRVGCNNRCTIDCNAARDKGSSKRNGICDDYVSNRIESVIERSYDIGDRITYDSDSHISCLRGGNIR